MMAFTTEELKHVSTCLHGLGECRMRDFVAVVICGVPDELSGVYLVHSTDFNKRHASLLMRLDWVGQANRNVVWKTIECFTQIDHEGKYRWIVPETVAQAYRDALRETFNDEDFIYAERLHAYKLAFNQAATIKEPSAMVMVQLGGAHTLRAEYFTVFQRSG